MDTSNQLASTEIPSERLQEGCEELQESKEANPRGRPTWAILAVLTNPKTPDIVNTYELSNSLGVPQNQLCTSLLGKGLQRVATAHEWIKVKARRLGMPGNSSYLIRQSHLDSLYTKGITRKGMVWAGVDGTGASPDVPPIESWLTLQWLQGIDPEVLAA